MLIEIDTLEQMTDEGLLNLEYLIELEILKRGIDDDDDEDDIYQGEFINDCGFGPCIYCSEETELIDGVCDECYADFDGDADAENCA